MIGFKKTGRWDLVGLLTANLDKEIEASNKTGLKQVGLIGEKLAQEHLSNQDLSWKPLGIATQERKKKKGQSDKILIATSTYFQAITSQTARNMAWIGVKKEVRNKDGEVVADIAAVHEYGSLARNIPARPYGGLLPMN